MGITRIDHPPKRTYGWMVRLSRNGNTTHEWFADAKHGGKDKAEKAAARRFRQLLKEAPPPASVKGRLTSRNHTGQVGVHIAHDVGRRTDNNEYYSYVASWTDKKGRYRTVKFSWNKYGKRRAFALAALAREFESNDREWIEAEFLRRGGDAKAVKAPAKTRSVAKKAAAKKAVAKKSPAAKKVATAKKPAKKAAVKKAAAKKVAKKAVAKKVAKKAASKAVKKAAPVKVAAKKAPAKKAPAKKAAAKGRKAKKA